MPDELSRQARAVDDLVATVVKEAQDLRRDVMAYEAAHRRERRAYRFMGAFLLGAIIVCLLLINTVRDSSENIGEAVDFVQSCTTPEGECYKRNQVNTGDFRQRLLGATAIITDCDVSTDDLKKFRKCVKDRTALDSSATSDPVTQAVTGKKS
jgi:hypothetical protein